MNKKILLWMTVIVVVSIALVVFLGRQKETNNNGKVVVRITDYPTTPSNWEIANRLTGGDVFKEEGVDVQLVPSLASVGPPFQSLLSGQVDVGGGAWVGWINVNARGGKIKAVYSNTLVSGDYRAGLLVPENSAIHSIKDLKGKTVAVNTLGLAADYVIKLALQKNGVAPDQVQLLQVPVENEEQALRTGQVDAAAGTTNGGTWFEQALERGGLRIIPHSSEYEVVGIPDHTPVGYGFKQEFIDAHPDAVRRYVTAVEKAEKIIGEAFQKDPQHVRDVYAQIAQEKGGNPKLGKYYLPVSPYKAVIKDGDIQFWIDALVSSGKLKSGEIKPSDIYTNEFNPLVKSE